MPNQKPMWTRCLGWFSVMWVTKLMIFPVEIRIFCPKTTKFGPKLAFLVNLGQAMQAYSMPCCGSVGGCGARAVSRKTPIYFIRIIIAHVILSPWNWPRIKYVHWLYDERVISRQLLTKYALLRVYIMSSTLRWTQILRLNLPWREVAVEWWGSNQSVHWKLVNMKRWYPTYGVHDFAASCEVYHMPYGLKVIFWDPSQWDRVCFESQRIKLYC